jgi:hypothetical protein
MLDKFPKSVLEAYVTVLQADAGLFSLFTLSSPVHNSLLLLGFQVLSLLV